MLTRKKKISKKVILTVSILIAAIGMTLIALTRAAGPTTSVANIWVDTNGGSCTRQQAPSAYSDTQACSSLNDAYQAADPGDIVYVKGGNYTSVPQIQSDVGKNGNLNPVTIEESPGESVILDDLATSASNIILKGFEVDYDGGIAPVGGPDIRPGSQNVIIDGIRSTILLITGNTKNVTVKNSEFGPFKSANGSQIKTAANGGDDPDPNSWPDNTTLDNVYFHDYSTVSSGDHTDCLHVFYHIRLTVRNSRFINCPYYGVLLGSNGSGSAEHDLIENNVFSGSGNATDFGLRGGVGEDFNDVVVRYNSGGYITPQTTNTLTNVKWISNAATDLGSCRANLYRYNVSTNTNCGGVGNIQASPLFESSGQHNYKLQPGSPAIDHGDPLEFPASDLVGAMRPFGALPDAGAYEFGSSSPPQTGCSPAKNLGNINCDTKIDIFDLSIMLNNYGKTTTQAGTPAADINNSGTIDLTDLSILLSNYGI